MSTLNDSQMEKGPVTIVSDNSNSVISVLGDGTTNCNEIAATRPPQVVEPVPVAVTNKKRRQGLMDITELSPELLSAYKIVTQLMSVSNKNVNYAFMNPINYSEPENENYTEVIKKPMWLNKVKLKLLSGRYNTISQVVRDLRLVLENCYRFYGPTHAITKKAIKLETMLEQKLALLPRELKEKTSLQLTTPELVTKVENNAKATNSKAAPKLGSHKDESSLILNCVRQARAKQEREARRLQMEEKRAERDATNQELFQWEESFYGNELINVKKMWELPQIGHFLYLVQTVLNIPEVSQFELERAFLKPQCSSLLASIMTSLLSSPHQRTKLDEIPAMTYKIWQSRLKMKVQAWYRVFNYREKLPLKVFENTGVEPMFFSVMGNENPLDSKEFHELNLKQRVWLVKSMCDHCLQNHKTIQDAISESSLLDQKEYALGKDKEETTYIHFPQFCGQSLRVYKQYFDSGEAPDFEFPLLLEEVKTEICENNLEESVEETIGNSSKNVKPEKKPVIKKEPDEKVSTPVAKKRKGRKATSWSSRRRRTRKKIVEEELEEEESEDVKPIINPFFELVVDNIESLRKLTAKFSGKEGNDETATISSIPATPSAPNTPSSSRASPSPAPSPIPDEILLATPNSRSSRRSKVLATIALKKGSATAEVKKERKREVKDESDEEENDSETLVVQNADEKNLRKRLSNLLKELEPWEQKLDLADRKIRFKLKKEWEDFQMKVTSPEAEAANEYWGAHVADEFNTLAAAAKLEDEVSSSSDESFYINAEKELAEANLAAKGGNEGATAADGSQFRKTHYRRCTKKQRVDKNVVTGPISSSEEQEVESDESSGSASSFHISVSSRGRIRKTKKLGFSFENQNENQKPSKNDEKEVENKPNGVVIDNKKRDMDNDAKNQYQWETMRQLIVDNSPKEIMTPLVPKLKIFKSKTSVEDNSPQQQPILENLLASQPGFGEMRAKVQTTQPQQTDIGGKLPDEPKYLQSFIQKHYQPPTQPKPLLYIRKDTNVPETQTTKTVVIRQSKDGGNKVIETSFAKHGTMKTTVSTNQEATMTTTTVGKRKPNPRQRQTCYANANAPATTVVANTKIATSVSFVSNVYKPGATQTDPLISTPGNKAPPNSTQMRVVVPQSPQIQVRMAASKPNSIIALNQQQQPEMYRPQPGNPAQQRLVFRPQQGNQISQGVLYRPQQENQLGNSGPRQVIQRPPRANQQVVYRLQQGNPAIQQNFQKPQQGNQPSQQVIYRPQQGNPGLQQVIQRNPTLQPIIQESPGPQQVIQRNPGPQQVIQRNTAPQQVIYRPQQGNPVSQQVMIRNPNAQQVMIRNPNAQQVMQSNPNPQQVMQVNPNPQQVMQVNPNPQQVMQVNPNPQQVMQVNPNPQQVMQVNPNPQQVMQVNPNPQQVMQVNPNPQQVMQRNPNPQHVMQVNPNHQQAMQGNPIPQQAMQRNPIPQQAMQRNPNPQHLMPGQGPQQGGFRPEQANPVSTQGTYRPQHQGSPSPQQVTYRLQQTNPVPSQVIPRPQQRIAAPHIANTRPQYVIAAPQQTNQQHQYRAQAPPQGNFNPQTSQQGNYNPQTPQQGNYNPHASQLTNYNPQGAQIGTFTPPAPQQGNYHPQGNFSPQVPQQGHFSAPPPQQSSFNSQASPQANYHPQGNFNPQAPQQGSYHPQAPQRGNFNPQSPQQGSFNPQSPQPANFNPQSPQQANFNPQTPQQGNFNTQSPQQTNYNPQGIHQANFNPQAPQPGNFSPQAPQAANFNPQGPQPANFNPLSPQQANFGGNFNPQQGNFNPQVIPRGTYGSQQGNYNPQTPQPGNYNPQSSQVPVRQEYHQGSSPSVPMTRQGIVLNQGVSNQICKVTPPGGGPSSSQQVSGPVTNSGTTRRVMIMPIKGNLQPGQKGPLVFKLVSRNNPNASNVQSITNSGVTFAKLVKSSNPGTGTSYVIKQNSNFRGTVPSTSPAVQTPPPPSNQIASPSNAFLNQPSGQTGQFYQPPSPSARYAGSETQLLSPIATPNAGAVSEAQRQLVLNNANLDPRINRATLPNNNNVDESLNRQSLANVPSPVISSANNVVVQCPVQIQTPNPVQYVTQIMTATTPASPVAQTNQRLLVCSPNPTFESNPNSGENVYFLTNSGQLVAFNKNSSPTTGTSIPSVSHGTIINNNLQNL